MQLLREWGIAESKEYQLTPKGKDFYSLWEMKQEIAIDVLHGLQYSLWTRHASSQNLASYAYQNVCSYLWDYQALPKTRDLITYIYDEREQLNESADDIANAFSSKSVNGAYDWLLPLSPVVLKDVRETTRGRNFQNATFNRRTHCSLALFLMGLSWVAREAGNKFGDLVAIGAKHRRQVCQFCLIDESRFDFILNETLRRFPHLSVRRVGGLYITIEREPKIGDF